jgi:probable addiction module antidote protein
MGFGWEVIRSGFLSAPDRRALIGIAPNGLEEHRVARRANAIILPDQGWSCERAAAGFVAGRRQAAGHQAGSDAGGDLVMPRTTRFDAADHLDTEARQVAYISTAVETGDADFVCDALGLVARARGMGEIAKIAGLNRESLYKALRQTGSPEFSTVMRIVRARGLTLSAHPTATGRTKRRRVA